MGMHFRILQKLVSPLPCLFNLCWWNSSFFFETVAQNGGEVSVKKVKNPVVNSLMAGPEFIDLVTQKVRFRPAEFMPQLL